MIVIFTTSCPHFLSAKKKKKKDSDSDDSSDSDSDSDSDKKKKKKKKKVRCRENEVLNSRALARDSAIRRSFLSPRF